MADENWYKLAPLGGRRFVTIFKDYDKRWIDSFKDPFLAIQELVDNSRAKGSSWNAKKITISLTDERHFEFEDDGQGMLLNELDSAFCLGHDPRHALPEGSIYSRYGQGFTQAVVHLMDNFCLFSKAKDEKNQTIRSILAFGHNVHETRMTYDLISIPPCCDGQSLTPLRDFLGATWEYYGGTQDSTTTNKIMSMLLETHDVLKHDGGPNEAFKSLIDIFSKMPDTGILIKGHVRPYEKVGMMREVWSSGEGESLREVADIVNSKGQHLTEEIAYWYMPSSDYAQDLWNPKGGRGTANILVNGNKVQWEKHPWVQGVREAFKPSPVVQIEHKSIQGKVIAEFQSLEVCKTNREKMARHDDGQRGFFLYYNDRALWRRQQLPEDRRNHFEKGLRSVKSVCQKGDKSSYESLLQLTGREKGSSLPCPTRQQYLPCQDKDCKYAAFLLGRVLMMRVRDDVVEMREDKMDLKDCETVKYMWDTALTLEIERAWKAWVVKREDETPEAADAPPDGAPGVAPAAEPMGARVVAGEEEGGLATRRGRRCIAPSRFRPRSPDAMFERAGAGGAESSGVPERSPQGENVAGAGAQPSPRERQRTKRGRGRPTCGLGVRKAKKVKKTTTELQEVLATIKGVVDFEAAALPGFFPPQGIEC